MDTDLLFSRRWPKSSLAKDVAQIDIISYSQAYLELKTQAPTRPPDREYLGGRSGYPSTTGKTNRREEHFAIAMVNAQQNWLLPNGVLFELIDYQVPLKASRADREIGKIDMFGITEHGRPVVVELKVIGHAGGPSDPPPVALLEGLRYAAIVEANLGRIADECRKRFGREMRLERPEIVILGETDWWSSWLLDNVDFTMALEKKAQGLSQSLGLGINFASIPNAIIQYGQQTIAPRLKPLGQLEYPSFLPKSANVASHGKVYDVRQHEELLHKVWWAHATKLSPDDLDGREGSRRPPVASAKKPYLNLMLPEEEKQAAQIKAEITPQNRHRHFGSFKSSQALAQSVFGAFKAADCLDLLAQVRAECGRPAFGTPTTLAKMSMEVDVHTMNEPRSTQLDVCLEMEDYRVAVECKFCEPEFGTCSRVRASKTETPICNGSYTRQQGRQARCALSETGITYWDHIPSVFDWDTLEDLSPCPLLPTYQIVRNVLAAIVDSEGSVHPTNGHAIFVYDARNPVYRPGGEADNQLRLAFAACRVPGLIRRVTWQEIVRVCTCSEDLVWLISNLERKHGIRPSLEK